MQGFSRGHVVDCNCGIRSLKIFHSHGREDFLGTDIKNQELDGCIADVHCLGHEIRTDRALEIFLEKILDIPEYQARLSNSSFSKQRYLELVVYHGASPRA